MVLFIEYSLPIENDYFASCTSPLSILISQNLLFNICCIIIPILPKLNYRILSPTYRYQALHSVHWLVPISILITRCSLNLLLFILKYLLLCFNLNWHLGVGREVGLNGWLVFNWFRCGSHRWFFVVILGHFYYNLFNYYNFRVESKNKCDLVSVDILL